MDRPFIAAVAAVWLGLMTAWPTPSAARQASDPVAKAEAALGRDDPRAAAGLLEDALPTLTGDRKANGLRLLRDAYRRAAVACDRQGLPREASAYRENLEILDRLQARSAPAPTPAPAPAVIPPPTPTASEPSQAVAPPAPLDPPPPPEPLPKLRETPSPPPMAEPREPATPPLAAVPRKTPVAPPSTAKVPTPAAKNDDLARADEAFRNGKYAESTNLYAGLAQAGALPTNRREHWAYGRCVAIVDRINARPNAAEWSTIHDELSEIKALSPQFWFTEYLRNVVVERSGRPAPPAKDRQMARAGGKTPEIRVADRGQVPASPPKTAAASPVPNMDADLEPTAGLTANGWKIKQTKNFRIMHSDEELADRVAQIAEETRVRQAARWSGSAANPAEWSPRCDIYLYPNPKIYAQQTGQPADSPGFSTMGMNGGKIVNRRLNLRADHPSLLEAVLPHEVTHVVLADLFPNQPIPRWADEGMAVLSEPESEQQARIAELDNSLREARLFKIQQLMTMDYPDSRYWSLYYAQSVSLTNFLVKQGTPAQFVTFLQSAESNGIEAELRRVYKVKDFAELHRLWLESVRKARTDLAVKADLTDQNRR